jgi:hypothetical protein
MLGKCRLVLPCDPEYTGHRDAEKRRRETREWLLQRERASIAPSIVPDEPERESYREHKRSYSHSHHGPSDNRPKCDGRHIMTAG